MNSNDSKVIIINNEPTLNLAKMKIKLNLNLTNVYYPFSPLLINKYIRIHKF